MGGSLSSIPLSNKGLIERVDTKKNSVGMSLGATLLLARKLRESKGRLRSEFKGISLSECNKLREFAESYLFIRNEFWPLPNGREERDHALKFYHEIVLELRSMEDEMEMEMELDNSNLALPSSSINVPMPTSPPLQSDKPLTSTTTTTSVKGLVTNQNGYVSGDANGSVIIIRDCKFSY